jgi:hypothetical protein
MSRQLLGCTGPRSLSPRRNASSASEALRIRETQSGFELLTWWAILVGLFVEYFFVRRITNLSLSRAALGDVCMNAVSALLASSSFQTNAPLLDRLTAFGDLAPKKAPAIIHRFLDNCLCIQVDVSSLNSPHNLQKRILSFETSLKKSDPTGSKR